MARDFNSYLRLLKSLLPKGRAWTQDGVLIELLTGEAVELARIDARVDDLLIERDTRTTTELIAEHEADFSLPDECLKSITMTLTERRTRLTTKLRELGSLHKQYYINLAATLGYTITIDEFKPAWCGLAVANDPCGDQNNLFYWLVNVHYNFVEPFIDYPDLECILNKLRPAHTVALFRIYGPGFSNGFSSGFNAMPAADLTIGGFSKGFSKGFNVHYGGGFNAGFNNGFDKVYGTYY